MAKKNTQQPQEQFKTMIGGQALIEGIMMLGPEKSAVVVRTKDGSHAVFSALRKMMRIALIHGWQR